MNFEEYLAENQAFIFELDNVIYPKKDYLLQVYYLFAQFMEYDAQISALEIVEFMKEAYFSAGEEEIFYKTAEAFKMHKKYEVNFKLLMHSAKLPLKLLIFKDVLSLLMEMVSKEKQIFLFTDGDPGMQLNKIKQMDWQGLEKYLTVYFSSETEPKPSPVGLIQLISKHQLRHEEVLMIGTAINDEVSAAHASIKFLNVNKLLLN